MIIYTEDPDLYEEDCYPYYFNVLIYNNVIGINLMYDGKYRSKATKIVYLKPK